MTPARGLRPAGVFYVWDGAPLLAAGALRGRPGRRGSGPGIFRHALSIVTIFSATPSPAGSSSFSSWRRNSLSRCGGRRKEWASTSPGLPSACRSPSSSSMRPSPRIGITLTHLSLISYRGQRQVQPRRVPVDVLLLCSTRSNASCRVTLCGSNRLVRTQLFRRNYMHTYAMLISSAVCRAALRESSLTHGSDHSIFSRRTGLSRSLLRTIPKWNRAHST